MIQPKPSRRTVDSSDSNAKTGIAGRANLQRDTSRRNEQAAGAARKQGRRIGDSQTVADQGQACIALPGLWIWTKEMALCACTYLWWYKLYFVMATSPSLLYPKVIKHARA